MIKFFRRIRQRLITENKLSKYLLYAVGEILLVMIGILLALQVNTWNEKRKTESTYFSMLEELKFNLKSDIDDIELNMGYHKQAYNSSKLISNVLRYDLQYNDSLDSHFSSVLIVPLFVPTTTAYTKLKETGTDLIKNDSLRYEIIGLYDRDYVFLKDWIGSERKQMYNNMYDLYQSNFESIDFMGSSHPSDFNDLIENKSFINYINHKNYYSTFTLNLYKRVLDAIKTILRMIDAELLKN
ncbi:MAG: hypothetical protein HKN54_03075 [Flavobacteriaceae bacterium]|nr:hypothetical protein [Flavobacteriaceae bacterium]